MLKNNIQTLPHHKAEKKKNIILKTFVYSGSFLFLIFETFSFILKITINNSQ